MNTQVISEVRPDDGYDYAEILKSILRVPRHGVPYEVLLELGPMSKSVAEMTLEKKEEPIAELQGEGFVVEVRLAREVGLESKDSFDRDFSPYTSDETFVLVARLPE